MALGDWVCLNGEIVRSAEARISPFDRGFLFAHAAYEVTAVYGGRLVDFDAHMARLERTLTGIDVSSFPDAGELARLHRELLARNGCEEGLVYLQISAGDYGFRDFAGPEAYEPTLFMFVDKRTLVTDLARTGVSAITLEDMRWARRDLKTTQLLSQALAYRRAVEAGAVTAIMHEDGHVTEAASANVWVVFADGTLTTRDLSPRILPGITRAALGRELAGEGSAWSERAVTLEELTAASEVFTSSAGAVITPVIAIDGAPVGTGRPGPVTRRMQALYYRHMGADPAAVAPWLSESLGAPSPD